MAITNTQIGTSETILLTAGGTTADAVLSVIFCNTDLANAYTFSLYAYTPGSYGPTNMIINTYTITAGDTFVWAAGEKFMLSTGDKLSAIANVASKITATVSHYTM